MDSQSFFKGENFEILYPPDSDVIIWTVPEIEKFCKFLITANKQQREYFFRKGFNNSTFEKLPRLFSDPRESLNLKDKCKSAVLNEIEFYNNPDYDIKELVKIFISENILVEDEFKLLKCNKCDSVTLSHCFKSCPSCGVGCKKQTTRKLFHLSNELSRLFYNPGKVIEGVVYHKLKSLEEKGLTIATNLIICQEAEPQREIDIVIKNESGRLMVIHITIKSGQNREKTIFDLTANKLKIHTIFATIEVKNEKNAIMTTHALAPESVILWDIAGDNEFPINIENEVKRYFKI